MGRGSRPRPPELPYEGNTRRFGRACAGNWKERRPRLATVERSPLGRGSSQYQRDGGRPSRGCGVSLDGEGSFQRIGDSKQRELIRRLRMAVGWRLFLGAARRPVAIEWVGHFAEEGLTSKRPAGVGAGAQGLVEEKEEKGSSMISKSQGANGVAPSTCSESRLGQCVARWLDRASASRRRFPRFAEPDIHLQPRVLSG